MNAVSALFRGGGWGLPEPLFLETPLSARVVAADRPDDLPALLEWLDGIAGSGDAGLLAVGYVTYEAGVVLEGSQRLFRPPDRTPLAFFATYRLDGALTGDAALEAAAAATVPSSTALRPAGSRRDQLSPEDWAFGVAAIRAGIERGDVYQVNLTRRVTLAAAPAPFALAAALHDDNPVPYALALAAPDLSVVSNSPELFLDIDLARRRAASAPIKGTIARTGDPRGDEEARVRLLASEKDAAEHVMIVDLIRNDLGRVAVPGGVGVPRFRTLRTFRHLHHLESTVTARLGAGTRLSDALAAMLPAGSITGAPKRASLRFIHELEPCPRGPYTGAMGYVRGDGRAVFNVAIRTAVVSPAGVDYHAGGGIVWDSDADAEWRETETKSRELAAAIAALDGVDAADGAREAGRMMKKI